MKRSRPRILVYFSFWFEHEASLLRSFLKTDVILRVMNVCRELPTKPPMAGTFNLITLFSVAAALLIWFVLDRRYAPKHSPREPPMVSSSIPYIGHILGLLQYGTRYYQKTR